MKVYVGNLPKQVNDAQLNELAVPFGTVQSASVVTDRGTGESKGFGFLVFANEEGARAAIGGLDGKQVHGQALKVSEAKSKDKAPAPSQA